MGKIAAIVMLALWLAACAGQPTRIVEVPAQCPVPPVTARPHLPIADLRDDSTPDAVIKAFAASLEACAGYAEELETWLETYRKR